MSKVIQIDIAEEAELCLICFPHAGGWPSIYAKWDLWLSPKIKLVPVILPGRGERLDEDPHVDLRTLLDEIIKELKVNLNIPVAFYGSCFGAICAFEVAKEVIKIPGTNVKHLFVSSQIAPGQNYTGKKIYDLPEKEFIHELVQEGALPEELAADEEMLEIMMPALRADYKIYDTYKYRQEAKLLCPITAFKGDSDETVDQEAMNLWQWETEGPFRFVEMSGGHLFDEGGQKIVVDKINNLLLGEENCK